MSTQPPFAEMFSHMTGVFAEIWGSPYVLTLAGGRVITVSGIWFDDHLDEAITDHDVNQRVVWPKLDFRRAELVGLGLTNPESDLYGATLQIDGSPHKLVKIRDDGKAMVRCRVSTSRSD